MIEPSVKHPKERNWVDTFAKGLWIWNKVRNDLGQFILKVERRTNNYKWFIKILRYSECLLFLFPEPTRVLLTTRTITSIPNMKDPNILRIFRMSWGHFKHWKFTWIENLGLHYPHSMPLWPNLQTPMRELSLDWYPRQVSLFRHSWILSV